MADGKRPSVVALRGDHALLLFWEAGFGPVRQAVDMDHLLRLWRAKAELLTAALPPGQPLPAGVHIEPVRELAPRLAKHLVDALLEFLCQTIRADRECGHCAEKRAGAGAPVANCQNWHWRREGGGRQGRHGAVPGGQVLAVRTE